jgi:hypothetical protein
MKKKPDLGSGIWDKHPGFAILLLSKNFFSRYTLWCNQYIQETVTAKSLAWTADFVRYSPLRP